MNLITEVEVRRKLGGITRAEFRRTHRFAPNFPSAIEVAPGKWRYPEDQVDRYVVDLVHSWHQRKRAALTKAVQRAALQRERGAT